MSSVVTQGRGGRPSGMPGQTLGCDEQSQPGEPRIPPCHGHGHTPKELRNKGEIGEAGYQRQEKADREKKQKIHLMLAKHRKRKKRNPPGQLMSKKKELSNNKLSAEVTPKHVDGHRQTLGILVAQVQRTQELKAILKLLNPSDY